MNRHVRELEEKTYDNLVDLGVSKIYDNPVTDMNRRDIENIELMRYFKNCPLMLKLADREYSLRMYVNHTFYIDNVHFSRPSDVKNGVDVLTHAGQYYGDPYMGYQEPKYLLNVLNNSIVDNEESDYRKKLTYLDVARPAWFFIDEHTLCFIGNGNLYESFKDENDPQRNFDDGIFSDKAGEITKVIVFNGYFEQDDKSTGLNIKQFCKHWDTLPRIVILEEQFLR